MTDRFVLGVPLGRWQTNCYLVGDRALGTGVVVDPGEHAGTAVPALLEQTGVRCEAILLTHGHLDHLWAVPELARTLGVPVHLHPDDRWLWDDPAAAFGMPLEVMEQQYGLSWDAPDEHLVEVADGDALHLAGIDLRVAHTPGHTPGSVTYLGEGMAGAPVLLAEDASTAADGVLFSGDLLFAGSIGRTDLPRGSTPTIMRSLATTISVLDDETLVLAGHGPHSTIGRERRVNPYLRGLAAERNAPGMGG